MNELRVSGSPSLSRRLGWAAAASVTRPIGLDRLTSQARIRAYNGLAKLSPTAPDRVQRGPLHSSFKFSCTQQRNGPPGPPRRGAAAGTMRDGKLHPDCAPLAPSHRSRHAVYSIGKIVCWVSEPCGYNSADSDLESIRVTEAGPGTTITVVPQNPKPASEGNTGREAEAHKPPRREPMDAAARLAGTRSRRRAPRRAGPFRPGKNIVLPESLRPLGTSIKGRTLELFPESEP